MSSASPSRVNAQPRRSLPRCHPYALYVSATCTLDRLASQVEQLAADLRDAQGREKDATAARDATVKQLQAQEARIAEISAELASQEVGPKGP